MSLQSGGVHTSCPGEHEAIIDQSLWDKVHATLADSPRARTRAQTPRAAEGALYGPGSHAFSPTHKRKVIVTPDGAPEPQPEARPPRIDNALMKALARAFRWRRMLESGDYGSIADLARAEKIGRAYVSTRLRLTLLAPEIGEAILAGRQGEGVTFEALRAGAPVV